MEYLALFGLAAIYSYATIPVQMACPNPIKRRWCLSPWVKPSSTTEISYACLDYGVAEALLHSLNIKIQN